MPHAQRLGSSRRAPLFCALLASALGFVRDKILMLRQTRLAASPSTRSSHAVVHGAQNLRCGACGRGEAAMFRPAGGGWFALNIPLMQR